MWFVCSSSPAPSQPAPWSQMMTASLSDGWRFAALEMKSDSVPGHRCRLGRGSRLLGERALVDLQRPSHPTKSPMLPSGAFEYFGERSMNTSMSRPGPLPTLAICMRFGHRERLEVVVGGDVHEHRPPGLRSACRSSHRLPTAATPRRRRPPQPDSDPAPSLDSIMRLPLVRRTAPRRANAYRGRRVSVRGPWLTAIVVLAVALCASRVHVGDDSGASATRAIGCDRRCGAARRRVATGGQTADGKVVFGGLQLHREHDPGPHLRPRRRGARACPPRSRESSGLAKSCTGMLFNGELGRRPGVLGDALIALGGEATDDTEDSQDDAASSSWKTKDVAVLDLADAANRRRRRRHARHGDASSSSAR